MRSNYKSLGNYIREVNIRDIDLKVNLLLGVSIQKKFIPSIANIIGTDMSTYKIVKKHQFAYGPVTSRNGDQISIALLGNVDQAIVSQAYITFEITDTKELLPEYLMMWFMRPEFDRFARFKSHGSTREVFNWDEMCAVRLPVPHPNKQKEIVKEYNVLKDRIALNNKVIQKLEETAQAIYKQWFVDFEFPDENGKPYKSSGGEMEYNAHLEKEAPKGWGVDRLRKIVKVCSGFAFSSDIYNPTGQFGLATIKNVQDGEFVSECDNFISDIPNKMPDYCKLEHGDILLSLTGNVGRAAIVIGDNYLLNQRVAKIVPLNRKDFCYIYFLIRRKEFQELLINLSEGGTAQQNLSPVEMSDLVTLLPHRLILDVFASKYSSLIDHLVILLQENKYLKEMNDVMLSKLATISQ